MGCDLEDIIDSLMVLSISPPWIEVFYMAIMDFNPYEAVWIKGFAWTFSL